MHRILVFLLLSCGLAAAQQTILNVPSADVLDKGQDYLRADISIFPAPPGATIAPNFIFGLGHNIEAGVNINAFGIPAGFADRALVPNIKWRFKSWAHGNKHLDLYAGDQFYLPTFHRPFQAGNFLYAAGALSGSRGTRLTLGLYDSQNVVVPGNKAGIMAGLEQTVKSIQDGKGNQRPLVTLAGDWQSGQGSNGALTLGAMFFPTSRLMLIPAYQLPNSRDPAARGPQIFVGYLFKK